MNNSIKKLFELLIKNWALVASMGYLYLSIFGMSQAYFFYNAFNINIFEYSEINDFVLASLKEPLTLLFGLGFISYLIFILLLLEWSTILGKKTNEWISEKWTKWFDKRKTEGLSEKWAKRISKIEELSIKLDRFGNKLHNSQKKLAFLLVIPIIFGSPIIIPKLLNENYSQSWKDNYINSKKNAVSIKLRVSGELNDLAILGTTDKYIFFYKKNDNKLLITPVSNVLYIEKSNN